MIIVNLCQKSVQTEQPPEWAAQTVKKNIVGEVHEPPARRKSFVFLFIFGETETFHRRAIHESPLRYRFFDTLSRPNGRLYII